MFRLFVFLLFSVSSGYSQISFNQTKIELGSIAEASEVKGDVILKNTSSKKIYLMRADADKGVKVYTSKKTLLQDDSCLLVISFIPETTGRFKKEIKLVSTDKETPYELSLSGSIQKVKTNDKTACFYFGSRRNNSVSAKEDPIIIPESTAPRDNTNKIPDPSSPPVIITQKTITPKPVIEKKPDAFSEEYYRPNNILFLVDVSSSMRDSLKLPVMKNALHLLIDAVRPIDSITFVTYASKVIILKEAVSGADKKTLHTVVDSLKAKGMTSGNKAILVSQQIAQKHFITNGNNQIIMASDGQFKFEREDFLKWKEKQGTKKIILTTVAFGDDKEAMKNLKEIAAKGEGSFIPIQKRSGSDDKLLNEIKQRSKR